MARGQNKRKLDVVDLTEVDGGGSSARPSKASRPQRPEPYLSTSNGNRFGENTTFLPLSQASLLDEDDAGAVDLIQGSQDFEDATYSEYQLYGMLRFHVCYM
jgi:SWI/SNF-related matrix-associated actin-dependent regulator of chromatin subfamily A3